MLFQLTPPIQRATDVYDPDDTKLEISTHAPYTEGDKIAFIDASNECKFQLTPPIQRATQLAGLERTLKYISTHAPYTEGD